MPTLKSLSKGEPNGTNCSSLLSRNSRLVVSSKRFVMWSRESDVPYFEFLSFSEGPMRFTLCQLKTKKAYLPGMHALSD